MSCPPSPRAAPPRPTPRGPRRVAPVFAARRLGSLAALSLLALLAAWLLDTVVVPSGAGGRDEEAAALAEKTKTELRKRFPGSKLGAEIDKAKGEFHVVVLSRPLADARKWLG